MEWVHWNTLRPGDNDRLKFDLVSTIAQNMRENGYNTAYPIQAHPDGTIDDGETRWRAAQEAGLNLVYVTFVENKSDWEHSKLMWTGNQHRKQLTVMEQAKGLQKRLDKHNDDLRQKHPDLDLVEALAVELGERLPWVKERLALLTLIEEAQRLVNGGHLPLVYADMLVNLDPPWQRKALEYFVSSENPSPTGFRAVVNNLRTVQEQATLFDVEAFVLEHPIEEFIDETAETLDSLDKASVLALLKAAYAENERMQDALNQQKETIANLNAFIEEQKAALVAAGTAYRQAVSRR